MEEWRIDIDPVLLEAYEMAMAEIRGEDLVLAKARIQKKLAIQREAQQKNVSPDMQFGMDTARFESLDWDVDSEDDEADFKSTNLSGTERLFFKLWSNKQLNVRNFEKGDTIAARSQLPEFGYVIITGSVTGSTDKSSYTFGPGSVFCLAEGLANQTCSLDIVANNHVVMQCIPIKDALNEAKTLNQGLKGVCRFTVMRILNLKQPPKELI